MVDRIAYMTALECYLPERVLGNEELAAEIEKWTPDAIFEKVGIRERRVAADGETALDMAEKACMKLFVTTPNAKNAIDHLILVTESPDYKLPPSACILQGRLGLSQACGAFDVNLGCSGYVYGLTLAKSLVVSGVANHVLLVTSETYSKYVHPLDKSTRTVFGDGAAATLVSVRPVLGDHPCFEIGESDLGTDGTGYDKLIVPAGMARIPSSEQTHVAVEGEDGYTRSQENVYMDGAAIFGFTIKAVPRTVKNLLQKCGLTREDIDLYVPHQANAYMLSYLKKKLKASDEKFYVNLENVGNTVSSSIPIAIRMAYDEGRLDGAKHVMPIGFGVGLSWGSVLLKKVVADD